MADQKKMEYGAYQVINNCLKVKPGEKVSIITDEPDFHIGKAIERQALKITDKVRLFKMEDYGKRSEDGTNPLKFPDEIAEYLKVCQVSVYAATGKKGELKTFRHPMTDITDANNIRHAHMINIDDKLMETGMQADYAKIAENNLKVMKYVKGAKHAKVTTPLGTDLEVELNPEWKWFNCDGNIEPGKWSNLPDGEIFTCAKNANGIAVVDGVVGDYLCEKFGPLAKNPVTLQIKDGRVTKVTSKNEELVKEIKEYISQDENANRIGEFAIGTNLALDGLVGNLLQDEKFPSVHIAIGHGYPEKTGANWGSDAHLDCVITKTTVVIDGKTIMKDGNFVL